MPGPTQATYFATKAYVLSLSEALAVELAGTGVSVTALCPGATVTEFAEQAQAAGKRMFRSGAACARDVAVFGYGAMLAGRAVAVHGVRNRLLIGAVRWLPRRTVARLVARVMNAE
ncbi:MAG: SDR family NAD(P)-dependent oxidoreductase [Candidatus Krumholzibacteriia bacterium]